MKIPFTPYVQDARFSFIHYGSSLFHHSERTTTIGGVVGDYLEKKKELKDQAVHLLFSANRWEFL